MAFSLINTILWSSGIVLVVLPHLNLGMLSDYKICGDPGCESLMSRVQAIRDHQGKDCRFLSFRQGDSIFVYHKLTGKREDLWAGSIDKQFGYFPRDAVKEEQVYNSVEKVVETQKSDFFCIDESGYIIDSSHLESEDEDDDVEQIIQNELDSKTSQTVINTEDTNAESPPPPDDPSAESPASSPEEDKGETKEEAQEVPNQQGGSAPSSWLGSGWLGLSKEEEPPDLANGEKEEDTTEPEQSLTSSVTGWLGLGGEGKPDDATESRGEDGENADSYTSTMTRWLGFGGEQPVEKEEREEGESDKPADTFRSRRMSLDLEGSQLHTEEKEEAGTLGWLGDGLSSRLGFAHDDQDSGHEATAQKKTNLKEAEQATSGSWFDVGIGGILGFGKDKVELEEDISSENPTKSVGTGELHPAPTEEVRRESSIESEDADPSKVQSIQSETETVPDTTENGDISSSGRSRDIYDNKEEEYEPVGGRSEGMEAGPGEEAETTRDSYWDFMTQSDINSRHDSSSVDLDLSSDGSSLKEAVEVVKERVEIPDQTEDLVDTSVDISASSGDHEGEGTEAEIYEEAGLSQAIADGAGEGDPSLSSGSSEESEEPISNEGDTLSFQGVDVDRAETEVLTDSNTEAETVKDELGQEEGVHHDEGISQGVQLTDSTSFENISQISSDDGDENDENIIQQGQTETTGFEEMGPRSGGGSEEEIEEVEEAEEEEKQEVLKGSDEVETLEKQQGVQEENQELQLEEKQDEMKEVKEAGQQKEEEEVEEERMPVDVVESKEEMMLERLGEEEQNVGGTGTMGEQMEVLEEEKHELGEEEKEEALEEFEEEKMQEELTGGDKQVGVEESKEEDHQREGEESQEEEKGRDGNEEIMDDKAEKLEELKEEENQKEVEELQEEEKEKQEDTFEEEENQREVGDLREEEKQQQEEEFKEEMQERVEEEREKEEEKQSSHFGTELENIDREEADHENQIETMQMEENSNQEETEETKDEQKEEEAEAEKHNPEGEREYTGNKDNITYLYDVGVKQEEEIKQDNREDDEEKRQDLSDEDLLGQVDETEHDYTEMNGNEIYANLGDLRLNEDNEAKRETHDAEGGKGVSSSEDVESEAVLSDQTVPHMSQHPTDNGEAETGSEGAFGMFKNAFSFFSPTPAKDEIKESTDDSHCLNCNKDETIELQDPLTPGQEQGSLSDLDQLSPQDLQEDSPIIEPQQPPPPPVIPTTSTSVPTETHSHPTTPSPSIETNTFSKQYKNLLAHVSTEDAAVLSELFGRHKLQFLDYALGRSEARMDDVTDDESILLDVEGLLHYHRETLEAPAMRLGDALQEDKEKTRTLIALQKLETLLARVRETFSGSNQAGAISRKDKDTGEQSSHMRDSSMGADKVRVADGESDGGMRIGQIQPEEGVTRQILDIVHQIAEDSTTHIQAARELLIWLTVQVVSSLPDDIRPGPNLYGVPWEPVIISGLVGLVTMLLFTCRCYSSVKSRMYRSKERRMAEQVAQLLDEKCKVLETLSKCQQEYDDLEDSLRDSGVLAQTQKIEHLEMKARQLGHDREEMERDLEPLKDLLEQQREHRIEQERRITELEESMKKTEEETKDLQSQDEQAQTTLKVYKMNSDRLQRNLETAGEENTLLQESNAQLRQQVEGWAERVNELEAEISRCEVAHSVMLQDVANKEERIMSLTDGLLRMKALDSDLEEDGDEGGREKEASNGTAGKGEENGKGHTQGGHLQKVQKLIYAAKLNADLKSVDEDKDRAFAKLNDEVKAKEDLQVSIKELEKEKLSLQSESEHYSEQVQRLQQKLQIMTEMYQENELKLHRLLTVEEKERIQKEEKLNKADKNIAMAMEELNNYRQRAGEMEEELEKTKQSYQTQISAHEKKAHNNWLAARAAERDLSDIRRENALLRQKLTDTQFKLDALDKDPYTLDSLARPLPFRAERSPYGPSPLGRPASETRAYLSPPTLMDGPPARLSPRVPRGQMELPSGPGEMERIGGPHSDSGSSSPTWERDRRGPPGPPGPPVPPGHPGYMFPEPGGPMFRRPLPPPGSLPPGPLHLRGLPPGPPHPADMSDGPYRENSFGPGEHERGEPGPGERRTPPESDPRMGGPPPPGPPMGPMDGPFPRRAPYGPPRPDYYPPRGPGGPPMMPMWAPPPPGMFPPRFPPGGPPPPHYAPSMRPPMPEGLPPPSMMGPLPPRQQSLPSPPHSQSPEEHTPSPEDAI